ncbi:Chromate resistance protein ChrB [Ancylobacter dichloromethanicus]
MCGFRSGDRQGNQGGAFHLCRAFEENDEDLEKLKGWLAKIRKLDFYEAPVSSEADARLQHCASLLETYAKRVFDAHEENRTHTPRDPKGGS